MKFLPRLPGPGRNLAGTTLVAALAWACAMLLGLVLLVFIPGGRALATTTMLLTFAPPMAVLGAKRPQHWAWQFIVLSLLVVLALPELEALAWGGRAQWHPARQWFLAALVVMSVSNYLPTRNAPAALLYGAAQVALAADYLPWLAALESLSTAGPTRHAVALALMSAALATVYLGAWLDRAPRSTIDRQWIDFRNAYGAAWGLRVMERFNATALQSGWSRRLSWHGLVPLPHEGEPACPPEETDRGVLVAGLRSLLVRFVSPEWLARRVAPGDRT